MTSVTMVHRNHMITKISQRIRELTKPPRVDYWLHVTFDILPPFEILNSRLARGRALRTKAWQQALGGRCGEIQEVHSKDDARDYAQGYETKSNREKRKEGSQEGEPLYEEYGTYTQQGKRTDLHEVIEKVQNGMPMTELIEEMPGTVSRAYKMLRDYAQDKKFQTAREMVLEEYANVEWKEFQQNILDLVSDKPDGRTVHWYHEDAGNVGKTFLRKFLQAKSLGFRV